MASASPRQHSEVRAEVRALGSDQRGRRTRPLSPLADAVIAYAGRLRGYYPLDVPTPGKSEPLASDVLQIAFVLERKARALDGDSFQLWLREYAQNLFWTNSDRSDPRCVGAAGVAGDLEIALLAWGEPPRADDAFTEIAASVFASVGKDRPTD